MPIFGCVPPSFPKKLPNFCPNGDCLWSIAIIHHLNFRQTFRPALALQPFDVLPLEFLGKLSPLSCSTPQTSRPTPRPCHVQPHWISHKNWGRTWHGWGENATHFKHVRWSLQTRHLTTTSTFDDHVKHVNIKHVAWPRKARVKQVWWPYQSRLLTTSGMSVNHMNKWFLLGTRWSCQGIMLRCVTGPH